MKKKATTAHSELLPVVVLYEGDIDALISILSTSENPTVSFEHGDTVYETLAELREHQGEVLRDLTLRVEARNTADRVLFPSDLSVSFWKSFVQLYCDAAHELEFRQATEFLKANVDGYSAMTLSGSSHRPAFSSCLCSGISVSGTTLTLPCSAPPS